MSVHEGKEVGKTFGDYFEIKILKAYKKPFTMCVEEGTFISSHKGELLNSKSEWHQAKVIRTTTSVVQGGAETVRQLGASRGGGPAGGRGGPVGGRGGPVGGQGGQVGDQPRAGGQRRARGQ